jgi:hypothetical protein
LFLEEWKEHKIFVMLLLMNADVLERVNETNIDKFTAVFPEYKQYLQQEEEDAKLYEMAYRTNGGKMCSFLEAEFVATHAANIYISPVQMKVWDRKRARKRTIWGSKDYQSLVIDKSDDFYNVMYTITQTYDDMEDARLHTV